MKSYIRPYKKITNDSYKYSKTALEFQLKHRTNKKISKLFDVKLFEFIHGLWHPMRIYSLGKCMILYNEKKHQIPKPPRRHYIKKKKNIKTCPPNPLNPPTTLH